MPMELYQAEALIKDCAVEIRALGLAAPAPSAADFSMAVILVLEDMMETLKKLDEHYDSSTGE